MAILDFSKAFDTMPHERLISKCHTAGIRGKTLDWIHCFLTNRRQRVLVEGSGSSCRSVTSGVPQGAVLGPLLFLVYINDITDRLSTGTTARLFADDWIIYRLEKIQRRAARFVLNNYSYPPAPNSSVTTMLTNLGWQPLHTRRTVTRLTLFYRIVHQTIAIPNSFLTPSTRQTRSNHPYKFLHMQCRINQFKFSFFPRTVIEWNQLPQPVVMVPSSEAFKSALAAHLSGAPGFYYAHTTTH